MNKYIYILYKIKKGRCPKFQINIFLYNIKDAFKFKEGSYGMSYLS